MMLDTSATFLANNDIHDGLRYHIIIDVPLASQTQIPKHIIMHKIIVAKMMTIATATVTTYRHSNDS